MRSLNKRMLQLCMFCMLLQYIRADDFVQPKIVIIGAGPAGVAAGTKLLEYGLKDFRILEAEARFGGRIHTIPYADNIIDMGAQWCHGQKNNLVYEMVQHMNLLNSSIEDLMYHQLIRSNGEQVKESIQLRLQEIIYHLPEDETYEKYQSDLDFSTKKVYEALEKAENKDIDKVIVAEFLKNFDIGESCYEAADSADEIPASGDDDYEVCEGNQNLNWKDKGYKQFLRLLLKTEQTKEEAGVLKDHLELSKKVQSIEWQNDDLKAHILCEDGEMIIADHVIVTVSLGVLKAQHFELFKPALPPKKQKAIENINFGSVNKIFIEFEKPFWPENWKGFELLWRYEDLQQILGTDKAFLEGLHGFHVVAYQPRLLEGWVSGYFGRPMEALPLEVVKNETLALLQRILPWEIPNVLNFNITTWFSNPNFRGTYSYHSINTLKSGVKSADLEEPLSVTNIKCEPTVEKNCELPVVLFAGEATNTIHYSTVHGAVETGFREAKRLADFHGRT